jgi:hypothetical protein
MRSEGQGRRARQHRNRAIRKIEHDTVLLLTILGLKNPHNQQKRPCRMPCEGVWRALASFINQNRDLSEFIINRFFICSIEDEEHWEAELLCLLWLLAASMSTGHGKWT